jgi:hypothetical protein
MLRAMVFNATFNNITFISWLSVLLVEETGVPAEKHRPAESHRQTLSQSVVLKFNAFLCFVVIVLFWRYGCLFLFLGAVVVMSVWLLDFRTTYVISAYHH